MSDKRGVHFTLNGAISIFLREDPRPPRNMIPAWSEEMQVAGYQTAPDYFDCLISDLWDPCRLVRQVNQLSS
jgi:hypothetical protein